MKVGIAGAGIMGQLLAFNLLNAGHDVHLFDQGENANCSMAAAGLLTPITELEKNDRLIYTLGIAALTQHWPALLAQLTSPIYFQQQGSLALAHPRDQAELIRFIQIITSKLHANNSYQKLTQAEITTIEPEINKFQEGYYFAAEGQLDNQALLIALGDALIKKKITWFTNTQVWATAPGKILLQDSAYSFDWVFDCRGLGAKVFFNELRGVRGELIWLHAPEVVITRPIRFLHPRYSLYIVPRPNQIYLIGASEIEANDNSAISVRTTLELLTAAYYVHPGFAEARIIKTVAHCRPTLSDHLPKIKYTDGLIAVNGLYRHGFLIAPALAADIMQGLQQGLSTVCYTTLWEKLT